MAVHSKNWWACRSSESNYAGGTSGAAYSMTKLASGSKEAMPYPKTYGDNMFPYQKIKREKLESHDDDVYGARHYNSGWESIESSRDEYVQDAFYLDKIIDQLDEQGAVPSSYLLHWQDHIHDEVTPANDLLRYESFGVFIKELLFNIPKNDGTKNGFPFWTVKESCYGTKYEEADGTDIDSLVKEAWLDPSSYPISTLASFTINSQEVNGIEATLTITCKYTEDKEAGDNGNKYPYFLGVDIKLDCRFRNYTQYNAFIENLLLENDSNYTVKINTGITNTFIKITNMKVSDGDLNRIPASGMVDYSLTLESTADSVLTKEAS